MTVVNLSEFIPFVTTHRYRTFHSLGIVLVTMGWNNKQQGFYMTIQHDDKENWEMIWSHLTQRNPYPKSLASFLEVLKQFDICLPHDMAEQVKKSRKGSRRAPMWHVDAPYSPPHIMSHHYFSTAHSGQITHVHMGWNHSLEGFFLVIEKEDQSGEAFWSNWRHPNKACHYPQSLDLFLDVLDKFQISIPQEMVQEIISDKGHDKNKLVFHQMSSGKYNRCLVWE